MATPRAAHRDLAIPSSSSRRSDPGLRDPSSSNRSSQYTRDMYQTQAHPNNQTHNGSSNMRQSRGGQGPFVTSLPLGTPRQIERELSRSAGVVDGGRGMRNNLAQVTDRTGEQHLARESGPRRPLGPSMSAGNLMGNSQGGGFGGKVGPANLRSE